MKKSNLTKLFLMLCAMSVFMFGCTGGSGEESGILESIAVKLNFIPPVKGMRAGVVVGEVKEGEDGLVYVIDRETGEATSYIVKDSKKGEKPVIEKIVQDKVKVAPGDTVKFRVTGRKGNKATEPAGKGKGKGKKSVVSSESLVYIWEALTGGTLSSNTGEEVEWTAPQQPGEYLLGINIQDQDANEVGTNIIVPVGDQEVTSANKDSILSQLLSVLSKYNITGKVLDTDGNPVVNAEIATIPPTSQVLTAEDGTFTLTDLNIGKYTVTAQKDGVGHDSTVAIITDEDRDVSFVISANNTPIAVIVEGGEQQVSNTYPLTGVVKDEEGNPVEGAAVAIDALSKLTSTDAMGIYNILAVQGGTHVVKVTKAGYEEFSEAVSVTTGAVKNVELLRDRETLSVTVTDASGNGIEGINLTFGSETGVTNSSGIFTGSLIAGTNTLTLVKDGYASYSQELNLNTEQTLAITLLPSSDLEVALKEFNGTAGEIVENDLTAFGTDDFTISTWIKTTNKTISNGSYRTFLSTGHWKSTNPFYMVLAIDGRDGSISTWWNYAQKSKSIKTGLDDGNWHHVVYSRNAGVFKIYIDGVLDSEKTGLESHSIDTSAIRLGSGAKSDGLWDGSIDLTKIYKRALTLDEIVALKNQK